MFWSFFGIMVKAPKKANIYRSFNISSAFFPNIWPLAGPNIAKKGWALQTLARVDKPILELLAFGSNPDFCDFGWIFVISAPTWVILNKFGRNLSFTRPGGCIIDSSRSGTCFSSCLASSIYFSIRKKCLFLRVNLVSHSAHIPPTHFQSPNGESLYPHL